MDGNSLLAYSVERIPPEADPPTAEACRFFISYSSSIRRCLSCFMFFVSLFVFSSPCFAGERALSGLNYEDFEKGAVQKMVWKDNPFVQPADDVAVSDLRLTGIVYGETDAAAIINDRIVLEGEKIGFSEILDIERYRVILRNENGIFNLVLGGGAK